MRDPDYIEQGMIEAEKDNGFSVVRGGAMSPDSVIAQYRAGLMRPPVPYVAPEKPVEIPQNEVVFSVEMKRFTIGVSVVTVCGIILSNGALIAGIIAEAVAPVVAWVLGGVGIAFVWSCLKGEAPTVKHEHHYHKHEYNQYNGSNDNRHNNA